MADMAAKGRASALRGPANNKTKLDADAVRQIKVRLASGAEKRALGREFGMTDVAIHHIATGRNWSYVL